MEAGSVAGGGSRTEKQARALSDAALTVAERIGHPHAIGLATFIAGLNRYLVGQLRAARDLLERAERILVEQPGAIWETSSAQRFLLNSLFFLGDVPAVSDRVPELVKRARERGNLYAECYLRVRIASCLWLAKDDAQSAVAETVEGMRVWSQEGFHLQHYSELYAHVSCALYRGRAMEAMDRIQSTWPKLERSLLVRAQALRVEARHLRTRACLAVLAQSGQKAPICRILERDIAELRREGVPWAQACASFAQGLYHAVRGEPQAAQRWLGTAERELEERDMHLLAAATKWRRGELCGGDVGREWIAEARAFFVSRQIKNPERFKEHYAPGPP
jgi:hypothetical protein